MLTGETEVFREKLSQYKFVHHISHMNWPGMKPGHLSDRPAINRLSLGITPFVPSKNKYRFVSPLRMVVIFEIYRRNTPMAYNKYNV